MQIIKDEQTYIVQTYKRYALALVKGKGKYVWDADGKRYLDFFAGISVCNVGHCHPQVVAAIHKQSAALCHVSNMYYTKPQVELAKEIIKRSYPGKVFFANSGAEANEAAIKAARKWGTLNPTASGTARYEIISCTNSFHGRTLATLTATAQPKFHEGFAPLPAGFVYAAFNDLKSVASKINAKTVAIMIEPVQGEGGVLPADTAFVKGLQKLCKKHNLLLIFDEIQTGMGRTGTLFAYEQYGVTPDIMTLAKSLAGGLPLGAMVAGKKAASALSYGEHGSTFGGNLVSCAAALAMFKILTPALIKKAAATGAYFKKRLEELKKKYPQIKDVRGMGLMLGIELDFPGREIVQFCKDKGLLINCTQDTVLRFLPPLIIDRKDVDTTINILEEALTWATSKK